MVLPPLPKVGSLREAPRPSHRGCTTAGSLSPERPQLDRRYDQGGLPCRSVASASLVRPSDRAKARGVHLRTPTIASPDGPPRIGHHLASAVADPLPSRSFIYRCFKHHGLIELRRCRKCRDEFRRWERDRPMHLWQLDVMGGAELSDGTEFKVVTGSMSTAASAWLPAWSPGRPTRLFEKASPPRSVATASLTRSSRTLAPHGPGLRNG